MPGLLALVLLAACASWKRVGSPEAPAVPPERLPMLLDPSQTYRAMGLLADNGPIGFVGTARFLAGPPPDSMYLVVALSLRNRGLAFHREQEQFVADYHVDVTLRAPARIAAQAARDERIRVGTFRETQRSDESVIFQQFLAVVPGTYDMVINVRDRGSANSGHVEANVTVPALRPPSLSLPIAVYRATSRHTLDSAPDIVMNPRQVAQYGTDSLRLYFETYGVSPGTRVVLAAIDGADQRTWTDTLRVDSLAPVLSHVMVVPPGPLSIGRYDLRLEQGGNVMASTPFLVTFSDLYAVANLEDIVSLLRYFEPPDSLRALLRASPAERSAAWQRFWRQTDPNPATPENEAIDAYLKRVQAANEQFRDEGVPGWLTERGEVLITIGDPNEVLNPRPDLTGRGRYIQWNFYEYRLTLTFIDDTGFGRFRLDPRSRAEFQRVANRVRGW